MRYLVMVIALFICGGAQLIQMFCMHEFAKGCTYGTCHKLLKFFCRNLRFAIMEFRECLQNFPQRPHPLCKLAAGTYQLRNTFLGIRLSRVGGETVFTLLVKAA